MTVYLFTFVLLSFFTWREYKFLNDQFGNRKNSPKNGVVITSAVFASSFLFRSIFDIY